MNEKKNLSSRPIVRWIGVNQGMPDFDDSLRRLIAFACAEWIRTGCGTMLSAAAALSKAILVLSSRFPLELWLSAPGRYSEEIADFCEGVKKNPLPREMMADFPRILDLRGVECPRNAMKSRLVMTGLPAGNELEIWLDDGSPVENVPGALIADGNKIVFREKKADYWVLKVVKPFNKE